MVFFDEPGSLARFFGIGLRHKFAALGLPVIRSARVIDLRARVDPYKALRFGVGNLLVCRRCVSRFRNSSPWSIWAYLGMPARFPRRRIPRAPNQAPVASRFSSCQCKLFSQDSLMFLGPEMDSNSVVVGCTPAPLFPWTSFSVKRPSSLRMVLLDERERFLHQSTCQRRCAARTVRPSDRNTVRVPTTRISFFGTRRTKELLEHTAWRGHRTLCATKGPVDITRLHSSTFLRPSSPASDQRSNSDAPSSEPNTRRMPLLSSSFGSGSQPALPQDQTLPFSSARSASAPRILTPPVK